MKTERERAQRLTLKIIAVAIRIGTGESSLQPRLNRMLAAYPTPYEPIPGMRPWQRNPQPRLPG